LEFLRDAEYLFPSTLGRTNFQNRGARLHGIWFDCENTLCNFWNLIEVSKANCTVELTVERWDVLRIE
jgi:hypothetical protein